MISRISTYAGILQRQTTTTQIQSQMTEASTQATTGTYGDQVLGLGQNIGKLYSLQNQTAQQTAVQAAATSAGNTMSVMQTALTSMNTLVQNVGNTALGDQTGDLSAVRYTTAATTASGGIDQMLSLMNTTNNGKYVFSGTDSSTATMASSGAAALTQAQSLLSSAVSSNGGALDSSSVSSFESSLDAMFSDTSGSAGTNYSGLLYTASTTAGAVSVSTGGSQSLSYDVRGNSQSFRDVLKGMTMMSMLNASSSEMDDSAKAKLLSDATTLISHGGSALTNQAAVLGVKQSQLKTVVDTQTDAATATQTQISKIDSVDSYAAATRLTSLQNQLQASYEITSMISKLSFTNYMG